MADNIGVHWFRLDLRLADNPSIEKSIKKCCINHAYIYS